MKSHIIFPPYLRIRLPESETLLLENTRAKEEDPKISLWVGSEYYLKALSALTAAENEIKSLQEKLAAAEQKSQ